MAITIEVGNSFSTVKGLSPKLFKLLRKELSYTTDPKAAYFSGGWVKTMYLIDKYGVFPTGLFNRVKTFIQQLSPAPGCLIILGQENTPNRLPRPFKLNLKDIVPYPDQIAAAETALTHNRGGIVAPTGTGKSLIIALIAARHAKTLVVVPSLEIKHQLKATLNELLPYNCVDVENIDSKRLRTAKAYDCLIIDECHHAAARTYQQLNKTAWKGIHYRYFLTATFYRNQDNEQLLFEGICGQVMYTIAYRTAVEKGYIVPVEAFFINVPKQGSSASTWSQVYSELVVNNTARNKQIASLLASLSDSPVLCLVKEIAHGEILSNMTGIPFVNGADEESRRHITRFNAGKIKSLIGTTGVLGEGIDTKPAEFIVIAGLGKARSAFMQQIGRGVRRYKDKQSCKVILFRDNSHKFTLRHFKEQVNILKEELGINCTELKLEEQ